MKRYKKDEINTDIRLFSKKSKILKEGLFLNVKVDDNSSLAELALILIGIFEKELDSELFMVVQTLDRHMMDIIIMDKEGYYSFDKTEIKSRVKEVVNFSEKKGVILLIEKESNEAGTKEFHLVAR